MSALHQAVTLVGSYFLSFSELSRLLEFIAFKCNVCVKDNKPFATVKIFNCPNDWCTHWIDTTGKPERRCKMSMKLHTRKCKQMKNRGKRLIHLNGKKPNKYVNIAEHGIALDKAICKAEKVE